MTEKVIHDVVDRFAAEAAEIYGSTLRGVILYGSCARGDYEADSDIDLMILLDVPPERIVSERRRIQGISNRLDLEYDVVLTPVIQSREVYEKYLPASAFYQNVQREGVRIA